MLAILSLAWGLVVLLALMCLGRLLARLTLPTYRPDPVLAAGWGLAGMIPLGGVLNLLGLARAPLLALLIGTIILADLVSTWLMQAHAQEHQSERLMVRARSWCKTLSWMETGALLALATLILVKYAACLGVPLMYWDDKHAYLPETIRMLQTGSIGDNPFSERQIVSLNAQVLLNGLFLSVAPPIYAFLFDPGICWIMIAGFTWVILRNDLHASTLISCILTALVLMVQNSEEPPDGSNLNLGGYLTGAVLMLTALRTTYLGLTQDERLGFPWIFFLTLTVAGLCAIKTTFLVVAVTFTVTWYGLRLLSTKRPGIALELMVVGFSTIVWLSPWMIQQYLSGGTPLYPFLGHGTHIAIPELTNFGGPFLYKLAALAIFSLTGMMLPAIIALLLLGQTAFREANPFSRSSWAMLFAAVIGCMIISFQGGVQSTNSFYRYVQPILYAALIPAGLLGLVRVQPSTLGLAVCLAVFIGNQWTSSITLIRPIVTALRGTEPDARFFSKTELVQIHQAQQVIPAGAKVLASTSSLSQLDFNRNTIWNLDFPGMCSPGASMPLPANLKELVSFIEGTTQTLPTHLPTDDLLQYFRQTGVEYLIMRHEPNRFFNNVNISQFPRWNRIVKALGVLYYRQLRELASQCPVLYQEGEVTVLNLRPPSHPVSATPQP